MRKIIGTFGSGILFLTSLFVITGCPPFEQVSKLTELIINRGNEINSITIERGETVTLSAQTDGNSENIFVVWEIDNQNAAITGSGMGTSCSIRGMSIGTALLTVKAWRSSGDTPVIKTIPVTITEPKIRDIILKEPYIIGVGEERLLVTEIIPAWADSVEVQWSANSYVLLLPENKIRGLSEGQAVITAAAEGFSKDFNIEVKAPDTITNLSIYNNNTEITGETIVIGLYEELKLDAVFEPADAYTWFNWTSDNPDNVSVSSTGEIKGLTANSSAVIKVSASGLERQITVTVKNPVTGIRIRYDNAESLPVSNIIWLYPGEQVKLKVELSPANVEGIITWTGANNEVSFNANGEYCTITGGDSSAFETPAAELRITAGNGDNDKGAVSAVVRVKTQEKPVWAWDRARDGGLKNTGAADVMVWNSIKPGVFALRAQGRDTGLRLTGRGEYSEIPIKIGGNYIFYTESGFNINSSNSNGGNPEPIDKYASGTSGAQGEMGNPNNSTRMSFGTDSGITTASGHQEGVFNFFEKGGAIRISVDYEIIWTAGAGRNMWITINNNQANIMQSVLSTNSQLLIQPLTDPRGTRATAVTTLNVDDFITRRIPGFETLETAFIGIVCLSNGGSINISGIRIEKEE